ncbi:hypothetical protein TEA_003176 [Camellia sinensis var. sinensis]|uniref:Uncharacterized protein n=1 Tax=Camellia sinensis var. sinensis TaxID=542762 RepID=A0A4S4EVT9_CAMSN|nr:hypothetical protein TEA_003176 [Camellia sinensis var. sinensis]
MHWPGLCELAAAVWTVIGANSWATPWPTIVKNDVTCANYCIWRRETIGCFSFSPFPFLLQRYACTYLGMYRLSSWSHVGRRVEMLILLFRICCDGFPSVMLTVSAVVVLLRGAVQPLIEMLQSPNVQLREMSAFALGRLAQVLSHLLYLMRIAKKTIQRRIALALANLCSAEDQRTIFIDNNGMPFSRLTFDIIEIVVPIDFNCLYHLCGGLELLLGFLGSTNLKQQLDGSIALYKLANKATTLSPIDMAPPSLTPQAIWGENRETVTRRPVEHLKHLERNQYQELCFGSVLASYCCVAAVKLGDAGLLFGCCIGIKGALLVLAVLVLLLLVLFGPAGVCYWLAASLLNGIGGLFMYEDEWRLQIDRLYAVVLRSADESSGIANAAGSWSALFSWMLMLMLMLLDAGDPDGNKTRVLCKLDGKNGTRVLEQKKQGGWC